MKIKLSEHFTYRKLLRFTLPSIIMMIFTSIYGVVDGIFVSNFVGKTPFAAINLIMPFLMILCTVGFMIGTGGSALVSLKMGEGDKKKANQIFTMLVYVSVIIAILLSTLGLLFLRPISYLLGARGTLLDDCVTYGTILLPALVFFVLQNEFQSFFVTAEKPKLGLFVTVGAGLTNIVLDALFVAVFDWGLVGAAAATAASAVVGGATPVVYFFSKNSSLLRFTKAKFEFKPFVKTCANGSSELMTNISMSLVNILYNYQLMKFAGEDGVAAYGVIMYVNFIFISVFFGYSIGSAPIIGYHFGAQNHTELKSLFRKSLTIIVSLSLAMTVLAELLSYPLSKIFVGYDAELFSMTCRAFMLYSLSFLFMGMNIFGSSFFTALNNGLVSAAISFLRTLLFQVAAVLLLPLAFGLDGIWCSIIAAEVLSLFVTIIFFVTQRKRYKYV